MTEEQRIKAEFEAWQDDVKELSQKYREDPQRNFEAGWLAAKEDTLRTVRELGQSLFPPKH